MLAFKIRQSGTFNASANQSKEHEDCSFAEEACIRTQSCTRLKYTLQQDVAACICEEIPHAVLSFPLRTEGKEGREKKDGQQT